MHEIGFHALRVLGAAACRPLRRADHQRHAGLSPGHQSQFCSLVDDLVHSAEDKIGVLQLNDGAQTGERSPHTQAHEPGLGDGRVPHPPRTELRQQVVGHMKRAAELAHVLAKEDDARVTAHLLHDGLADGLHH